MSEHSAAAAKAAMAKEAASRDKAGPGSADPQHIEQVAADFLRELRRRTSGRPYGPHGGAEPLAERLAPAVARMTERLTLLACDRLARGDMTAFFETVLEAMTPEERSTWRREVTEGWFQAALSRWRASRELRRQVLETILLVKALAL